MNKTPEKGIIRFVAESAVWSLTGGPAYRLYLLCLFALIGGGCYAYSIQAREGLGATGMNDIVSWGLYISNFTFLVGVAAAAVMLILPAYIFKDKQFHRVVIIGEGVAVGALVMCLLFITVDLGGPLRAWHLIPGIGLLNWPHSILAWDIIVLNGYLALNLLIPLYILYCRYNFRKPDDRKYRPFVFLSIFWAVSIHMVTAFLYQGLPARPFWNNPLLGPRFLASAFAAGPALITVILVIIHSMTPFKIDKELFNKLRRIIVVAAVINLLMLFSEVFKEFYSPTHHSLPAEYLFFGLDGYDALVPWIWTLLLAFHKKQRNPLWLLPASVLLFTGIWIEKGFGLIIPGFIPSPLGEVTDYLPTGVEISITLGIFAVGLFVITMLIKPALVIEQRYEEYIAKKE
jgi:molybdopterin-containing oxidoreductase family membrane subunit